MSKSIDVLFQLLRISLGGCKESLPSAINWQEVMDIAASQNVIALAFDALESLAPDQRPDMDTLMDWLGQTSYQETIYEEQWKAAESLGELCHHNGIRCFVMKGFSLAALYPKPTHRSGSDLDSFCINADGKCCGDLLDSLLEKECVAIDRSYYKNSKFCYNGLTVENHQHVLPVKGSKKAKRLEQRLLKKLIPIGHHYLQDSKLESPSAVFLAVHTLAHAQEHFFEEGINLRHVTDWGMCLKLRDESFDKAQEPNIELREFWEEVLAICEEFGLLEFCYAMSRLAKKVCGVEIPFECPSTSSGTGIGKADKKLLQDILTVKHSDADNDNHRRIELITNIFRDSWKFKYFSDTNALMFALRRIKGYLFE